MTRRRPISAVLLGLAFACVLVFAPARALSADIEARAAAFIQALAQQAVRSLTKPGTPRDVRIERFRRLFNDQFAVEPIGKFVLGPSWRDATEGERIEYLGLFEDLMVVSYVDRFQRYAGENLKILGTRADNAKVATVTSDIVRPGAANSFRILWRVGAKGETLKILDVLVDGVSMSQTLRSDFASIIAQKGGRVSGLIEELRKKTAELRKEGG